jgi:ubiquinone/menaquinone biosynthesis C-methylase UbiE
MKNQITKFKITLFRILPGLDRLIAYNRYRRDTWVSTKAKLISNGSKVLDIGAGGCPYRSLFQHCDYKTQDFVQLSDEQIQHEVGYGKIDYVCDISNIPVENESFDVVLCTEVIEHVPFPIDVITETARILKPGGTLLITAPLQSGLHQEPYHFYGGFTKYWYEKFLQDNGYKDIQIIPNGSIYTSLLATQYTLIKQCLEDLLYSKLILKIVSFLFLIILLPLAIFLTAPFFFAEKFYRRHEFTAGYHVSAIKI